MEANNLENGASKNQMKPMMKPLDLRKIYDPNERGLKLKLGKKRWKMQVLFLLSDCVVASLPAVCLFPFSPF